MEIKVDQHMCHFNAVEMSWLALSCPILVLVTQMGLENATLTL